ncbi:efflux RND transporter periplasmic adaptor subunit [Paenibacillus chartarius]|uniref:Efflux RND transporter periplasmic adaptor subunit n=1 Tax=Paenibacillus chartarius TaxID=747481 RepID=A0ABV6DKE5_9BACL
MTMRSTRLMKKPLQTVVFRSVKLVSVVALAAALAAGCSQAPEQPAQAAASEPQVPTVRVQPIAKLKIAEPLEQVADVVSAIQLDIVAKSGGDVLEILKKKGEYVNKGDVLFRLDPSDVSLMHQKAALSKRNSELNYSKTKEDLENGKTEARNGLAKLEQQLKDLERNYNKLRNDYDAGLVQKKQLDDMETQMNNLKLDIKAARDKLATLESSTQLEQLQIAAEIAGIDLQQADKSVENLEVKAAASGVITDLNVEVGMTVQQGFRAGTIQQLDPIRIKSELTEETARLVRGKQELTFYIPGVVEKTKAKVSYLADVMNSTTKAYTLELEVPNSERKIRPGTKAQVLLTEEVDQNVVAIPSLSVVREGSETFVFVLAGEQVEKRKVELGRLKEANQEVLSGVKEGEQIVVTGQHLLKDKDKVQVSK